MKTQKNLLIVTLLAVMLMGSACKANPEADHEVIGMPNPASVFCEEQGGKVEIRTQKDGSQNGVCVFDDGSECDEWAFYREECRPGDFFPAESSSELLRIHRPMKSATHL
ncbi:MAG: DUF333 domain-containing protein [Anaerolineales bacterium]|nr:DUF333 domain-containing protein [Anaerolineales bacterium]